VILTQRLVTFRPETVNKAYLLKTVTMSKSLTDGQFTSDSLSSGVQREVAIRITEQISNATFYEQSLHESNGTLFFLIRRNTKRFLVVASDPDRAAKLGFNPIENQLQEGTFTLCPLDQANAKALRTLFPFTVPVLLGKESSYGFGDRLGNAGPAHLRAAAQTRFRVILAQQSIRELERTRRTATEVLDAASWAVFQEGYHNGFGADADHLKTMDDIDRMVQAGYTMFTIDPGEYVRDDVTELSEQSLAEAFQTLPWKELETEQQTFLKRYVDQPIDLGAQVLTPSVREVMEAAVKYGLVVTHTLQMSRHLKQKWPDHAAELELSVDETEKTTTPFEHFLIASELNRLGVEWVSLAPRFCGDFEKGVDFRGDLEQFVHEYGLHLAIAEQFGGYKLSIHSGSDKFTVYRAVGELNRGTVHVKTAGTSYLEALRTVADVSPETFREILRFSAGRFEQDRKSYHISAQLSDLPDPGLLDREQLMDLLNQDGPRQILHVTYGSVLSGEMPEARDFKSRIMELLESHNEVYAANLVRHFQNHLFPFKSMIL